MRALLTTQCAPFCLLTCLVVLGQVTSIYTPLQKVKSVVLWFTLDCIAFTLTSRKEFLFHIFHLRVIVIF